MNRPVNGGGAAMAPRQALERCLQAQDWQAAWPLVRTLALQTPDDVWLQQWRVVVGLATGHLDEARAAAQAALALLPADAVEARADVAFNLGQACTLLRLAGEAQAAFEQALALKPDHVDARMGRASAFALQGRHAHAGQDASLVLAEQPRNLEALSLVANSLLKVNAFPEALQKFIEYERIKPASAFTACMVLFLMRQIADWGEAPLLLNAEEAEKLKASVDSGEPRDLALLALRAWQGMPAVEPFSGLVFYDDPALQHHCAEMLLRHLHPLVPLAEQQALAAANGACEGEAAPPAAASASAGQVAADTPLRVAYVSNDFYQHATSFLLAGVLRHHNRQRVQLFLLSFGPNDDAMTAALREMGHTWVDIQGWGDAQVAQWCREQGIQVAVDLKGLTRDSRVGIFAHRAAPVQVNWLGYPGTMAAPYYDWVLADAVVLPPELAPHFAERVWRLPHSYQPTDNAREIARAPATPTTRAAHGLPEEGVVLCSFNNTFKFTPTAWAMWMRLLQAVPGSVLWLLHSHAQTEANLRAAAAAAGVDPARLVFAPKLPQAEHLARLQLADLSLETWPYNAHTTASDALWAGVPHLTCAGQSFASRVGASLVTALGMADELLASDMADYEARVLHLMRDPQALAALRARVQTQRAIAPLFDTPRFARDLEDAWLGIWAASQRADAPGEAEPAA